MKTYDWDARLGRIAGTILGMKATTVICANSRKVRTHSIAVDCTSSSVCQYATLTVPIEGQVLTWVREVVDDDIHDSRVIHKHSLARLP